MFYAPYKYKRSRSYLLNIDFSYFHSFDVIIIRWLYHRDLSLAFPPFPPLTVFLTPFISNILTFFFFFFFFYKK